MDNLPFSQACENNKSYILEKLGPFFQGCSQVLEVASGTGQHATFFAQVLPWLQWQPTELEGNLPFLLPRCLSYEGDNLLPPIALDVRDTQWPMETTQAIFTANSLHIMPMEAVEAFFAALASDGFAETKLAVYGPFNYEGQYTSESNQRFDEWLAQQSPDSAIRDFEVVNALSSGAGFQLVDDIAMPANNRFVCWQRG